MEEKWKQSFKDKLSDYQRREPPLPWSDIEAALNKETGRKRAAVLPWAVRILAAAASVALVFFLAGIVRRTEERPAVAEIQSEEIRNLIQEEPADEKIPAIAPASLPARRRAAVLPAAQPEETAAAETAAPADPVPVPEEAAAELLTAETEKKDSAAPVRPRTESAPAYFKDIRRTRKARRLTAAVYTSSVAGGWPAAGLTASPSADASSPETDDGLFTPSPHLHVSGAKTSERHYQPLRFGLSLRYGLTDRLSLTSGLSYSMLRSTFTSSYRLADYKSVQRLNYIGVPLLVSCRFFETGPVRFYAAAGGMAEKMVYGKSTTSVSGISEPLSSASVQIKPLQLSVSGALGIEYGLGERFSLFAEPGVSYYFDNRSTVKTFYEDKPLSFSLSLGLRMDLNR